MKIEVTGRDVAVVNGKEAVVGCLYVDEAHSGGGYMWFIGPYNNGSSRVVLQVIKREGEWEFHADRYISVALEALRLRPVQGVKVTLIAK